MCGKNLKKLKAKKGKKRSNGKVNAWKKALAAKIRTAKGKHFTGMFICDMCRNTHTHGYVYNIDNEEYEICKFCNDVIFQKQNYIKIIYTPMGNNQ